MECGISYSDYWNMTYGEISDVVTHISKERTEAEKQSLQYTYLGSYYAGYFSRVHPFPSSVSSVFPELFGKAADGGIPVENAQIGFEAMKKIAAKFNANKNSQKRSE